MTNQIEPDIGRTVEANESRRQKVEAERTEREKNEPDEEESVRDASHLSAKLVYQVVRREGDEERGAPESRCSGQPSRRGSASAFR